jgi:protein transport protein SEC31
VTPKPDGADVFDVPGYSRTTAPTLSLKQPPQWLRRPSSCSFGFDGQLVTVGNLPAASGKTQSSIVHIRKVIAETDIFDRAQRLQQAVDTDTLSTFAEERVCSEKSGEDGSISHFLRCHHRVWFTSTAPSFFGIGVSQFG